MGLAEEIIKLKKAKNAMILAHNYQLPEIQELGDFVGDSLALAMKAEEADNSLIVLCGADFMAETVKILSPEKNVLIPSKSAKCPLAGQLDDAAIKNAKAIHPHAGIVLYVNSSAEAKALADCCCTSANADKAVNSVNANTVLFGPDANLAYYVSKRTEKNVVPIPAAGYCYVHKKISLEHVLAAKNAHPKAEIVAHPECNPDVQEIADCIASTSGMLDYCRKATAREFIIATEAAMLYRLQKENPRKKFWPACEDAICNEQKEITLKKLYFAIRDEQFEVRIPKDVAGKARRAIERMLEIGR